MDSLPPPRVGAAATGWTTSAPCTGRTAQDKTSDRRPACERHRPRVGRAIAGVNALPAGDSVLADGICIVPTRGSGARAQSPYEGFSQEGSPAPPCGALRGSGHDGADRSGLFRGALPYETCPRLAGRAKSAAGGAVRPKSTLPACPASTSGQAPCITRPCARPGGAMQAARRGDAGGSALARPTHGACTASSRRGCRGARRRPTRS